jgi:hypothetical protein
MYVKIILVFLFYYTCVHRVIERAIDKLARRHGAHINEYDANNGADNARRLTGKNGMPHIRDFTAGTYIPCFGRHVKPLVPAAF